MAARTPQRHGTPMTVSFAHFRRPLHVMAAAVAALALAPVFAQSVQTPELEAAVKAVQRADQADADQYAPEPLAAARQFLAQAQATRNKKEALDFALRAAADADLARARSEEAVATAEVGQRRAEIADLQRQLGEGGR